MAYRTTEAKVRARNTELDPSVDIDVALEYANMLVTAVCTASGYTDAVLEIIERELATHLATVNDPRTTFEGVGTVQESTEGKTGLGLEFTRFGQQVKILDWKGNLASLDNSSKKVIKPPKVGVFYVGGPNAVTDPNDVKIDDRL